MPNWTYCEITIDTNGFTTGEDLLATLQQRSHCPEWSFSLTSCVAEPIDLSDEPHGPNGWYDWRITHWGTKWDICSGGGDEPWVECSGDMISISGDTAWSPPIAALDGLAAAFPETSIDLGWSEPNMVFEGFVAWANGKRLREWTRKIPAEFFEEDSEGNFPALPIPDSSSPDTGASEDRLARLWADMDRTLSEALGAKLLR